MGSFCGGGIADGGYSSSSSRHDFLFAARSRVALVFVDEDRTAGYQYSLFSYHLTASPTMDSDSDSDYMDWVPPNAVVKLKGKDNYYEWKWGMETILQFNELWLHVDPEASTSWKPTVENNDPIQNRALTQWMKEDAKAKAIILSYCQPHIAKQVARIKSPREQWQYLAEKYAITNAADRGRLFTKWKELRYDGKDLDQFCGTYVALLCQMDDINLQLPNEVRCYHFLDCVAPYLGTLGAMKKGQLFELTAEDMSKMEICELIRDARNAEDIQRRYAPSPPPAKQPKNNKPKCSKRQCVGHKLRRPHRKDQCWKLHPELDPRRKTNTSSDNGNSSGPMIDMALGAIMTMSGDDG